MQAEQLDEEEKVKMAKVGLEMKLLTTEVDAEAEKWDEYAENDIVKRAKSMSSMAYRFPLSPIPSPTSVLMSEGG